MARRFEFSEGKSNKFWEVSRDGSEITVTYGRIGTSGQTKTKDYGTESKAEAEVEKLIAQKVGKGYEEIGGSEGSGALAAAPKAEKPAPKTKAAPVKKPDAPEPLQQGKLDLPAKYYFYCVNDLPDPIPYPKARKFDLEARLKEFNKKSPQKIKFPEAMTPEEARFWLYAAGSVEKVAERLGKELFPPDKRVGVGVHNVLKNIDLSKPIDFEILCGMLEHLNTAYPLTRLLYRALTTDQLLHVIDRPEAQQSIGNNPYLFVEFQTEILPYIDLDTREKIKAWADPRAEEAVRGVANLYDTKISSNLGVWLSCALGNTQLAEKLVASLPDKLADEYMWSWNVCAYYGIQLPEGRMVEQFARKFDCDVCYPGMAESFLARTGPIGLSYLGELVVRETNKEYAKKSIKLILPHVVPEAAEPMARIMTESKAMGEARDFLRRHYDVMEPELQRIAQGSDKIGKTVKEFLKLQGSKHPAAEEQTAGPLSESAPVEYQLTLRPEDYYWRIYDRPDEALPLPNQFPDAAPPSIMEDIKSIKAGGPLDYLFEENNRQREEDTEDLSKHLFPYVIPHLSAEERSRLLEAANKAYSKLEKEIDYLEELSGKPATRMSAALGNEAVAKKFYEARKQCTFINEVFFLLCFHDPKEIDQLYDPEVCHYEPEEILGLLAHLGKKAFPTLCTYVRIYDNNPKQARESINLITQFILPEAVAPMLEVARRYKNIAAIKKYMIANREMVIPELKQALEDRRLKEPARRYLEELGIEPEDQAEVTAPAAVARAQSAPAPAWDQLDIPPIYNYWRTYDLPQETLPIPEPRPFDLNKHLKDSLAGYANVPLNITPEEARFWLYIGDLEYHQDRNRLKNIDFTKPLSRERLIHLWQNMRFSGVNIPATMILLFDWDDDLDWVFRDQASYSYPATLMANSFTLDCLPYLTAEQRVKLKECADRLAEEAEQSVQEPAELIKRPECGVSCAFGNHRLARKIVDAVYSKEYPYDSYNGSMNRDMFGLYLSSSEEVFDVSIEKNILYPYSGYSGKGFLAHVGAKGLAHLAKSVILSENNKEWAEERAKAQGEFLHTANVAPMIDIMLNSKATKIAYDWIRKHFDMIKPELERLAKNSDKIGKEAKRILHVQSGEMNLEGVEVFVNVKTERSKRTVLDFAEYRLPEGYSRKFQQQPMDEICNPFREKPIKEMPPIQPVDRDMMIDNFLTGNYSYWRKHPVNHPVSKEDAAFLVALESLESGKRKSKKQVEQEVDRLLAEGKDLDRITLYEEPECIYWYVEHFGSKWLLEEFTNNRIISRSDLFRGFRDLYLPTLNQTEIETLRKYASQLLKQVKLRITTSRDAVYQAEIFYAAALLGCPEIKDLVEEIPKGYCKGRTLHSYYYRYDYIEDLVLCQSDPEWIVTQFKRLGIRSAHTADFRAFMRFGRYDLMKELLSNSLSAFSSKEEIEGLMRTLDDFASPEVAEVLLGALDSRKHATAALSWMNRHTVLSASALIRIGFGKSAQAGDAMAILRTLYMAGKENEIRLAAEPYGEPVVKSLEELVFRDYTRELENLDSNIPPVWLAELFDSLKDAKLPDWVELAEFQPLRLGKYALNPMQATALLAALQESTLEKIHPLAAVVRDAARESDRDQFAWTVFQQWLREGAPSKERWAIYAIGLIGGENSAMNLTPLIKQWPGESQHQRAVTGLEVLAKIGTDTAIMQINSVANKVKFKGIKERAREFMERIAEERGMSKAELEDRIVPDCGLDENGTKIFDFGPRQFQFVLGPGVKPMIRGEDGKLKPNLPKPGAKDDQEKADAATNDWKLMKKVMKDVLKLQAIRLEQAMVTGRRWTLDEFERFFVKHPLTVNYAKQTIFQGFDEKGEPAKTFTISEDRSYADASDEETTLEGVAMVGIAHPLRMEEGDKNQWGEYLADYEIIPPFQQIGRPVYTLEPGEESLLEITRFAKIFIGATTLLRTLENMGWDRGEAGDGGGITYHTKRFHSAGIIATIEYQGVYIGDYADADDQSMETCYFEKISDRGDYWSNKKLELGQIDDLVISEVLRDMNEAASKGK